MDTPTDLPRLAKDYTEEQRLDCIAWFATEKTLPELREYQDIINAQIAWAHDQQNDEAVEDQQAKYDQVSEAIGVQAFDIPAYIKVFVLAYAECALWSSSDIDEEGNGPESLLDDYGFEDIAPETWERFTEDCTAFVTSCWRDLQRAARIGDYASRAEWEPAERAGHDFWLTRNGHGAGFWDRGMGDIGDRLTAMAKPFGECYLHLGGDTQASKVYIL